MRLSTVLAAQCFDFTKNFKRPPSLEGGFLIKVYRSVIATVENRKLLFGLCLMGKIRSKMVLSCRKVSDFSFFGRVFHSNVKCGL